MTLNGRKVRLKKSIRRILAGLKVAVLIALMSYCMIILFFWTLGIDIR